MKDVQHSHFAIWAFLVILAFNAAYFDCSGSRARNENRIRSLEYKVQQLENNR